MGSALTALQGGPEMCITSPLRRRRQGVETTNIGIRDCGLRDFFRSRTLDFDAAERRAGNVAAGAYAKYRQRRDDVQHRRLFVVSCRSKQGSRKSRSQMARWRLGLEVAFWRFLRAEHFARSQGRHRRLVRSEFRHGLVEGYIGARGQSLSGFSVHLLSLYAA